MVQSNNLLLYDTHYLGMTIIIINALILKRLENEHTKSNIHFGVKFCVSHHNVYIVISIKIVIK